MALGWGFPDPGFVFTGFRGSRTGVSDKRSVSVLRLTRC